MSGSNSAVLAIQDTQTEVCELSKVLNKMMTESHIDAIELSRHTNIPVPTIHRLKSDRGSNPTIATLLPIANYFGVTINQLIGKEEIFNDSMGTFNKAARKNTLIPIIPIEETAQILQKNSYPTTSTSCEVGNDGFAIIVKHSLIAPQFPENTILIFSRHLRPEHRDYMIVRLDGHQKPTLRQLLIDGDDWYFKPLSEEFGEITLSQKHDIVAVMVQASTNYRE